MTDTPSPGSKQALKLGCTCAVIDNHYGRGFPSANGTTNFWITADCPLHGGYDIGNKNGEDKD